jgi:hypothetical protein
LTTTTDIVNRALQSFGSRTALTSAQLSAGSNNEAKQANLSFANCRDSLLRMAPWDCGMKTANLVYITSVPGTPENTSAATNLWQPGQPRPPWAYEYQYPVDCLRACWVLPASQTGSEGIPISPVANSGVPSWTGRPARFKVGVDEFYMASAVSPIVGGTGYAVNDVIEIAAPVTSAAITNLIGTFNANSPPGANVKVRVTGVLAGVITAVEVISQLNDADTPVGGSLFYVVPAFWEQLSTSGNGTGATFNLSFGTSTFHQRVIYTNQEFATLCYIRQITDPNVWDPLFQDALADYLGGTICYALTGDKALANLRIQAANRTIEEARTADGNEGLTINDVTPDWIRARGYAGPEALTGPYSAFDWGGLLPAW